MASQVGGKVDAEVRQYRPQRTRRKVLAPGLTDGGFEIDEERCAVLRCVHCTGVSAPPCAARIQLVFGQLLQAVDVEVIADVPEADAGLEVGLAGSVMPRGVRIQVCFGNR